MLALSLLPLLLVTVCFASPFRRTATTVPASALPPLPAGLTAPKTDATFVTVGFGMYNSTCTTTGTNVFSGVSAQLFDITSLFSQGEFGTIQTDIYSDWVASTITDPNDANFAEQVTSTHGIKLLGTYTAGFVEDLGSRNPEIDFTSAENNGDAFVVAKVTADVPSPTGGQAADWQELQATSGGLASTVLLIRTVGGGLTENGSCNPSYPGQTSKFTAQFWGF